MTWVEVCAVCGRDEYALGAVGVRLEWCGGCRKWICDICRPNYFARSVAAIRNVVGFGHHGYYR